MIRAPQAPPEAVAALREPSTGLRETALRLAPLHQVFTATLADVLERRLLASAQPSAWRDVAGASAAEAAQRGGEYVVTSVNEGPFVAATGDAFERAQQVAEKRDYELRVLSIPALYVFALWLHADDDNILIPMSPAPSGLIANEPYSEMAFTEALRPLAERRSTTPMV